MYTVIVESTFSAMHQLRLGDGVVEPLHGHDWRVRAHLGRAKLDGAGMVVDFEHARGKLEAVLEPLRYTNLSDHDSFRDANATAEVLARYVSDQLVAAGLDCVRRVEITESPGCVAIYENGENLG